MPSKILLPALFGALLHTGAGAHPGHGLPGSAHWHATDALGLLALAVVAAVLWALHKRK